MAEFAPNVPVPSTEPTVVVDKGLPAGTHVFRLQVQDNLGQVSEAVQVNVVIFRETVVQPTRPPIVIK